MNLEELQALNWVLGENCAEGYSREGAEKRAAVHCAHAAYHGAKLPEDRSKWLLEPKLDGYRAIAVKSGGEPNLYSMDAKVYNQEFPAIFGALSQLLHKDLVLDGEIVALEGSGRPNFNALQNRRSTSLPIYYIAFDCLHFKGRDLLDRPLEERKKYLADIAADFVAPMQKIFEFDESVDLQTAITVVRDTKIEGLVAKKLGSLYYPDQESDLWRKHRFNQEDKFFIGGYIPGSRGIGELLIGEYRPDGKLYFIKRESLDAIFERHNIIAHLAQILRAAFDGGTGLSCQ